MGMEQIKHLIILMMENRSFDHYLGALSLDGRTDIWGLTPVRSLPELHFDCRNLDPTPRWCAIHASLFRMASITFYSSRFRK